MDNQVKAEKKSLMIFGNIKSLTGVDKEIAEKFLNCTRRETDEHKHI